MIPFQKNHRYFKLTAYNYKSKINKNLKIDKLLFIIFKKLISI